MLAFRHSDINRRCRLRHPRFFTPGHTHALGTGSAPHRELVPGLDRSDLLIIRVDGYWAVVNVCVLFLAMNDERSAARRDFSAAREAGEEFGRFRQRLRAGALHVCLRATLCTS